MYWLRKLCLVLLLFPSYLSAQAVVDTANASSATTTGAGPLNFSHNAGSGSNRVLTVGCSGYGASGDNATVTGITYNSVAMTLVDRNGNTSGSNHVAAELWKLVAPTTGSNTVSVSFSESAAWSCGAVTTTGVDQTTPNRTASKATSGDSYPNPGTESLTPTSSSGDAVIDVIGWRYNGESHSVGSGQTQLTCNGPSPSNVCMSTEGGAAGTTTMSWSWTNSWTTYSAVSYSLIPAATGVPNSLLMLGVGNK